MQWPASALANLQIGRPPPRLWAGNGKAGHGAVVITDRTDNKRSVSFTVLRYAQNTQSRKAES